MNEALKTLEAMTELLHQELKRVSNNLSNDETLTDKSYMLIKSAMIDSINLREKIAEARGWNTGR